MGDEPGAERGSVARAAAASAEHRHHLFVEHDHARVHFVGSVLRICHMRAPIQARHASARRTHVFEAAARTCSVARWLLDDTSALSWSVTASRAVHLQRCGSSRDARIAIVASIVWNASPTAKSAQLSHLNSNHASWQEVFAQHRRGIEGPRGIRIDRAPLSVSLTPASVFDTPKSPTQFFAKNQESPRP